MAQMTRDDFVTELKVRGWSRFLDAQLQKYVDFALRDVNREANFKAELSVVTLSAVSASPVAFSTINSGLVQTIEQVDLATTGYERKLQPMDSATFELYWLPNPDYVLGIPTKYYVYENNLYLMDYPSQALDFEVHITGRLNAFANGSATSGLPEDFDEAILPAAEAHCFRRAHEFDRMAVAQAEMRRVVLGILAAEGHQMPEEDDRVVPYR